MSCTTLIYFSATPDFLIQYHTSSLGTLITCFLTRGERAKIASGVKPYCCSLMATFPLNLSSSALSHVSITSCLCSYSSSVCLSTDPRVVGFAMYYFTYDPWVGKQLYLEEFYVMDQCRGLGIGSEILRHLSNLAMKTRCTGMMFVVAENNEPSVQFYKRRGAEDLSQEEGWRLFRFDMKSLVKMATPAEE
ncbi:diamine acetyltransferase 1-like isoform 1-T1 [Pholidichthys leucotaenia]